MKEKIIKALDSEDRALDIITINNLLSLDSAEDLKELSDTLEEMHKNGEIYRTNKGKYMLFKNCPGVYCGKLQVNRKGFGFVIIPLKDDLYIPAENLNGAVNNDLVTCEVVKNGVKPEGRIIEIIKRDLKNLVGTIEFNKKGIPIFIPDDSALKLSIKLDMATTRNCVDGHKVLISLGKDLGNNLYVGSVIKILGHKNDPGMDIKSIAYKYGIYDDFGPKVEKELEQIPDVVNEKDLVNRRDLTDMEIFTIDGDDTKDIDDAISLSVIDGMYHLGVHIADVSYYVKENTALGDSAFERGTSSYLADTVIPMLPHKLSNGICSLNEGVIRLTISCDMTIDQTGKVLSADIFPSYIQSRKKMTYKNVNKIIMENEIPDGYEDFVETLNNMNTLAKILRKRAYKNGYIDFDLDEAKIVQDEKGEAIDVIKRERGDGEKLIENFMIAANESVASYIYNIDLPFIYRVHGAPDEERVHEFADLVTQFGYKLETNLRNITPHTMQKLLEELKDKPEFKIISSYLLRSMKKAIYSKDNIGHFGLASKSYTHFTSPIRRFPDLTVHRLLRTYIFNNDLSMGTIKYYDSSLVQVAEHSSEREQAAINAERDVDTMKMAEYMEKHIGEEFDAMVTSITSYGFYAQLPNLVEGLVHVKNITDDHYLYDSETFSLIGEHSNRCFRIGDTLRVVVTAASKETGFIDFEISEVRNGNSKQRS